MVLESPRTLFLTMHVFNNLEMFSLSLILCKYKILDARLQFLTGHVIVKNKCNYSLRSGALVLI